MAAAAASTAVARPLSLLYALRHSRVLVRESVGDAMEWCRSRVVFDEMCGRGSDSLTLGALLGSQGHVHAIDIQTGPVAETRARCVKAAAALDSRLAELTMRCAAHPDLHFLPVSEATWRP